MSGSTTMMLSWVFVAVNEFYLTQYYHLSAYFIEYSVPVSLETRRKINKFRWNAPRPAQAPY